MLKRIITTFVAIFLLGMAFAGQKQAALLPLESNKAYTEQGKNDAEGIYGALSNAIAELDVFTMVSRTSIDKLMAEKEFQQKPITDKVRDAKRIANADYLILGRLDELGNTYNLSVAVYDLAGTAIITAFVDSIQRNNSSSFIKSAKKIAMSLFSAPKPQGIISVVKTGTKVSVEWNRAEDVNLFSRKLEYKLICSNDEKNLLDTYFAEDDAEIGTEWKLNARRGEVYIPNTEDLYFVTVLVRNPLGIYSRYEICSTASEMRYKIGDVGSGGGIVFYASKEGFDIADGKGGKQHCNYLEVSAKEIGAIRWCPCENKECSPDCLDSLFSGKTNTYLILNAYHNGAPSNSSNCAALACYNYSTATTKKSEWFLPSRAEVYELRKYVSKNFFDDGVWTSSITENNYYERTSAVYIHSSFGYSQGSRYKFYNVLPVRAFSN